MLTRPCKRFESNFSKCTILVPINCFPAIALSVLLKNIGFPLCCSISKVTVRLHDEILPAIREIHPLEPQRHRHSMLAPRVCAPRVTRCSLGHVIWSVQLACSILSRSDSCQGDGRQRHLMMHGQCPIPVYSSQLPCRAGRLLIFTCPSAILKYFTCQGQPLMSRPDTVNWNNPYICKRDKAEANMCSYVIVKANRKCSWPLKRKPPQPASQTGLWSVWSVVFVQQAIWPS